MQGSLKRSWPDTPPSEDDAGMYARKRIPMPMTASPVAAKGRSRLTRELFAGDYVEGVVTLNEMRLYIRQEDLRVNTNCGHGNRTKDDVFRDIQKALQRRAQAEALVRARSLTSQFPVRLGNVTFEFLRDDDGHLDLQALRRFIRHLNLPVATNCGAGRTKEHLYDEIYAELKRAFPNSDRVELPINDTCDPHCHRCHTGTCVTNVISRVNQAEAGVATPSSDLSDSDDTAVDTPKGSPKMTAATIEPTPMPMSGRLPTLAPHMMQRAPVTQLPNIAQLCLPPPAEFMHQQQIAQQQIAQQQIVQQQQQQQWAAPAQCELYDEFVAATCLLNMGACMPSAVLC